MGGRYDQANAIAPQMALLGGGVGGVAGGIKGLMDDPGYDKETGERKSRLMRALTQALKGGAIGAGSLTALPYIAQTLSKRSSDMSNQNETVSAGPHTENRIRNIKLASTILNLDAIQRELNKYDTYQLFKSAAVGAHKEERMKVAALIRQQELEKQALLGALAKGVAKGVAKHVPRMAKGMYSGAKNFFGLGGAGKKAVGLGAGAAAVTGLKGHSGPAKAPAAAAGGAKAGLAGGRAAAAMGMGGLTRIGPKGLDAKPRGLEAGLERIEARGRAGMAPAAPGLMARGAAMAGMAPAAAAGGAAKAGLAGTMAAKGRAAQPKSPGAGGMGTRFGDTAN